MHEFRVRLYWDDNPGMGTVHGEKVFTVWADDADQAEEKAEELERKYSAVYYDFA